MAKTVLLQKADTEVTIGLLDKKDIAEYEKNKTQQKAYEQGYAYVLSTVKPSRLIYYLKAEDLIKDLLEL